MSATKRAVLESPAAVTSIETLRRQYACGAVDLTGNPHALYERHLFFDNVMHPAAAGLRERYEAIARSLRDVLSQRWVRTEQTYERNNAKRVYYLSMEFLIGRSLANNIVNLSLGSVFRPVRPAGVARLAWAHRTGARCRSGKRRPRPPCRLFSRLHGDDAATRDGIWAPLRVRNIRADDRKRLATRAAGQLASPPRSLGSRPPRRQSRDQAEPLVLCPRRHVGRHPRPALDVDRHSVRQTGGRVRWKDDQHAAPLVGGCRRLLRFPGVQPWRLNRRASGDTGRRVSDPGQRLGGQCLR